MKRRRILGSSIPSPAKASVMLLLLQHPLCIVTAPVTPPLVISTSVIPRCSTKGTAEHLVALDGSTAPPERKSTTDFSQVFTESPVVEKESSPTFTNS
ncbi:hypothetical protein E2C01_037043 [Portunus trituberculatus]|uniref:Secreted protein n=1 Tax=Portunus trituberculatus TaxID=210409 RepID=A0A5B7FCW7_PORTR|nr:hypothetical protein [Portunus trituberculatus]